MAHKDENETSGIRTDSPTPEDTEEYEAFEMTQLPPAFIEATSENKETDFMALRHTGNQSELKIFHTPHAAAKIIGRAKDADIHIPFPQVSNVQAVIICLGSGIYLVDVGKNGIFVKIEGKRHKLPVFPIKPPFPPDKRPKMCDMFGPLKPGMIIQVGNDGPCMDELGGQSFRENHDAEYEILHGEGTCGVGTHSSKRSNKSSSENEGESRGQKSTNAILNGNAAKKRRKEAKHGGYSERRDKTIRNVGSKGPNTKLQIFNTYSTKKHQTDTEKEKGRVTVKEKGKDIGERARTKDHISQHTSSLTFRPSLFLRTAP
jgi:hypothetical protein